tara:strand:+ start:1723 stop:3957 length:2235 start_codon:yes stop_codon:yes gene_type:complete
MSTKIKYSKKLLKEFEDDPVVKAESFTLPKLETFLLDCNHAYYNTDKPLLTDNTFDILIDYLKTKDPNNKVLNQIGAIITDVESKVKLPYHCGSMDKIKPGSSALNNYLKKYSGPYTLSEKLDGLSGLVKFSIDESNDENDNINNTDNLIMNLYSRGDGNTGQDISHLLSFLKMSNDSLKKLKLKIKKWILDNDNENNELCLRGEIIMKKNVFESKYKNKYPKARSLVAGIVNSKASNFNKLESRNIAKDIDLCFYQVVYPNNLKANEQFKVLKNLGLFSAKNEILDINKVILRNNFKLNTKGDSVKSENKVNKIKLEEDKLSNTNTSIDILKEKLLSYKNSSLYEIDGIIIADNSKVYLPNKSGNPKHAVAFKMQLDDQTQNTIIEEIEYNVSKNGVLKPRIKFKPIKIGGDNIMYATGFNAKFIKDNVLGPGAKIEIIRSGDVIPYVNKVLSPSTNKKWHQPSIDYIWNETGVDALVKNLEDAPEILSKSILHFFNTMDIDGMKIGTINRLINAGFDSLISIFRLETENLLDIEGFQIKSATKLVENIKAMLAKEYPLSKIMTASNVFTNFGQKKIKLITNVYNYKKIMENTPSKLTINELIEIEGYSTKSSNMFLKKLPEFKEWYKNHSMLKIDNKSSKNPNKNPNKNSNNNLNPNNDSEQKTKKQKVSIINGYKIVFTGFRDKDLESKVEELGGEITSTVSKNTNILVVKDKESTSSKITKAKSLKINIKSIEEFKKLII